MNEKLCKGCKLMKPITEYSREKRYNYKPYGRCLPCRNRVSAEWWRRNPEKKKLAHRKYYLDNKEKVCQQSRDWAKKNPEKSRASAKKSWHRLYHEKLKKNPGYMLRARVKQRLRESTISQRTTKAWSALFDFTPNDLKRHLETQFTDGMSWERFLAGEIHIDHIKSLKEFGYPLVGDPAFKPCWSMENLRPLWAKENMRLGGMVRWRP